MNYLNISNNEDINLENSIINFEFDLDNFQKHAIQSINNDHHTLVCVSTGSGKTLIAEYAIAFGLNRNKKVIYTAPIKSLSNQKFNEFKSKFHSIGILTGDIRYNPDATCMIMTTEIL